MMDERQMASTQRSSKVTQSRSDVNRNNSNVRADFLNTSSGTVRILLSFPSDRTQWIRHLWKAHIVSYLKEIFVWQDWIIVARSSIPIQFGWVPSVHFGIFFSCFLRLSRRFSFSDSTWLASGIVSVQRCRDFVQTEPSSGRFGTYTLPEPMGERK